MVNVFSAKMSTQIDFEVLGEDLRDGAEFKLLVKPTLKASANFIAVSDGKIIVTRRLSDVLTLPAETVVIANWHGVRRTDAFNMTVSQLQALADVF